MTCRCAGWTAEAFVRAVRVACNDDHEELGNPDRVGAYAKLPSVQALFAPPVEPLAEVCRFCGIRDVDAPGAYCSESREYVEPRRHQFERGGSAPGDHGESIFERMERRQREIQAELDKYGRGAARALGGSSDARPTEQTAEPNSERPGHPTPAPVEAPAEEPAWVAMCRGFKANWDSYDAAPIDERAIQSALGIIGTPPSDIDVGPMSDGGVSLTWNAVVVVLRPDGSQDDDLEVTFQSLRSEVARLREERDRWKKRAEDAEKDWNAVVAQGAGWRTDFYALRSRAEQAEKERDEAKGKLEAAEQHVMILSRHLDLAEQVSRNRGARVTELEQQLSRFTREDVVLLRDLGVLRFPGPGYMDLARSLADRIEAVLPADSRWSKDGWMGPAKEGGP